MLRASNRRWLRYRLRTLFIVVTIAGTVVPYSIRYYAWLKAAHMFDRVEAAFDDEKVTADLLIEASRRRLAAELNVPFASAIAAHSRHVRTAQKILLDFEQMFH